MLCIVNDLLDDVYMDRCKLLLDGILANEIEFLDKRRLQSGMTTLMTECLLPFMLHPGIVFPVDCVFACVCLPVTEGEF